MRSKIFQEIFGYFLSFTEIYQKTENKWIRARQLLKLQTENTLVLPSRKEKIIGDSNHLSLCINPQFRGQVRYFFDSAQIARLYRLHESEYTDDQQMILKNAITFWNEEIHENRASELSVCTNPEQVSESIETNILFQNMHNLSQKGIHFYKEELSDQSANSEEDSDLSRSMILTIDAIDTALNFYKYHVCVLLAKRPQDKDLRTSFGRLESIKYLPPKDFSAALQLCWLYAIISRTGNEQILTQCLECMISQAVSEGKISDILAADYVAAIKETM